MIMFSSSFFLCFQYSFKLKFLEELIDCLQNYIFSSSNSLFQVFFICSFVLMMIICSFIVCQSKRVRDRKGSQCQDHSNGSKHISSSSPMNSKRTLDDTSDHHDNTDHQVSEANLVKSCSSSISEPRKMSKIKKNSKNPNQELEFKARNMDKSGIYLLLMSFTVTILWGKLCAIFCNLIWLYFLPRRRHNTSRPENVRTTLWLPEKKESKDQYYYEKKVIMVGLLERKHQRVNDIKFLT